MSIYRHARPEHYQGYIVILFFRVVTRSTGYLIITVPYPDISAGQGKACKLKQKRLRQTHYPRLTLLKQECKSQSTAGSLASWKKARRRQCTTRVHT